MWKSTEAFIVHSHLRTRASSGFYHSYKSSQWRFGRLISMIALASVVALRLDINAWVTVHIQSLTFATTAADSRGFGTSTFQVAQIK